MKSKIMVKLPNGNFVNPAHVTCIELVRVALINNKDWTYLWVTKDAGYCTGHFAFEGDMRAELAGLLNGEVAS